MFLPGHLANSQILVTTTMIIYDHRPPVVKDHLVKVAIVMAYAYANSHNRAKYASVFPAFPAAVESLSPQTEPGEQRGVVRLQPCNDPKDPVGDEDSNTGKDRNYDPRLDYRFTTSVTFPPHRSLESYSWNRVSSLSIIRNTIYLNPKLLDEFERMKRGSDRVRLLVLIHCVVCHELAHLLQLKIYHTPDAYFGEPALKPSTVDCGTEVEHSIFGGRILSTSDFTKLRIERKDGTRFDVDPTYIWNEFLASNHLTIDFERLRKVEKEDEDECERWLGMGEINGTHERQARNECY